MNINKMVFLVMVFLLCFSSTTFADEKLSNELLVEYGPLLQSALTELKHSPEDSEILKEVGKLYFYIGDESADRHSTSKAIKLFQKILEKEPRNAEIKAYLGSAYTLKARDFPMKTILSLTPLGYIRLYYVNKGIQEMDAAVEIEDSNPFVRIVRGITSYNLPEIFGQLEKGINDFSLLISWIENPSLNKDYKELFTDESFITIVFYHTGEAYLKSKNLEKATLFFEKVLSVKQNTPYRKAAERMLNKIKNKDKVYE
ncbi:hypothetical protein KKE26_11515 [bacterium]|nr:hypothetical protein [bacterium]MBU1753923.1 hypothetical protein [bacterium]